MAEPMTGAETATTAHAFLLEALVCPVTRQPLQLDAARGLLLSKTAKLGYPLKDGVPILLPEIAVRLED